jgi:hypothetical protein
MFYTNNTSQQSLKAKLLQQLLLLQQWLITLRNDFVYINYTSLLLAVANAVHSSALK